MEQPVIDKIQRLLIDLDSTPEGQQILETLARTKKFDVPPPDSEIALAELKDLMDLLSSD